MVEIHTIIATFPIISYKITITCLICDGNTHILTLPSLAGVATLKSLITLYINICKITVFPFTQFTYIYMLAYLYVCCVTRINLMILHIFMYNVISDLDNIYMHIYRMSPYSNCIQFAYIYMLSYLYVCCVTRINLVILHIFMYNVISDLDNIYMHIYRMSPYSTGCNYDKGQSVKGDHVVFYLVFN